MTTAIVAATVEEAATAAYELGIVPGTWVYPLAYEVMGRTIKRVIYVEGWRESERLQLADIIAMYDRAVLGKALVEEVSRPASWIGKEHEASLAASALRAERRRKHDATLTPFIDWDAEEPADRRQIRAARPGLLARLWRRLQGR